MMATEDGAERLAHAAADGFGGPQFLGRAAPPGIEASPDRGVIVGPAAVEPRRMDAGGSGSTQHRVGGGGFRAG
ncbi:MAG: hypothetical protein RIR91_423 [Verrucomicrobiota bacterium]